jgi:hypothetical protein
MCDALEETLRTKMGLRGDAMITVNPTVRSPESLVITVEKMMHRFAYRWGRRHAVGPDRERSWLDYFIVTAFCEANHASHAHICLSEQLTAGRPSGSGEAGQEAGAKARVHRQLR